MREGNITEQINEVAEEMEANFIVIGTHGSTGFRNFVFGNHTNTVVKKSPIPTPVPIPVALFVRF